MPLYEYECDKCGHKFEAIQQYSDKPLTKCPVCKGKLRKLLSAPAIHFKGTGWYVTDYGKKDIGGTDKGPDKSSDKTAKEKVTTKADDKPSSTDSGGGAKPGKESKAGREGKKKSGD